MDTSLLLFSSVFEKWLSYKLVMPTERIFRHRWSQAMSVFGAMPKFPGFLREISFNNTNRYNIFLRDAFEIAGTSDFRWVVRGAEEYDPDYLIMDYETFYPTSYELANPSETYCFTDPKHLYKTAEVKLEQDGRSLINNCGDYYPYAFGKEIELVGNSWQNPKW
jgi:hypothetical protein